MGQKLGNRLILVLALKITLISSFFTPLSGQASKPIQERSEEACKELLSSSKAVRVQWFSPSTLIPVSTLLGSTRCDMVAKNWYQGDLYAKEFPSAGHAQMFRTADLAAQEIIEQMELVTVAPIYDRNNPIAGAAATLELIRSKRPPKYIRNAVLIRDGVLMVVPILRRTSKLNPKTKLPIYVPIVAKGHQDLKDFDILTAAFAAWMLEPWIGMVPDEALVYLKPMAEKRTRMREQEKAIYRISPQGYLLQIHDIYENFMKVVTVPERLESTEPRRCTHCARCPWAAHCRVIMKQSQDLSMMPFPPSRGQADALQAMGYGEMETLSKLDVNSEEFIRVALTADITPIRLRYFVAHALAFVQNKPLVMAQYEDPFIGNKMIVHIDFEDMIDPKVRSGVYLFGIEQQSTQNLKTGSRALLKRFIFSEGLDQDSIDQAWANFFKFLKTDPRLKKGDYVVTMYSAHELVKLEQELDVLKQPAIEFTAAERDSPYYSEFLVGEKKYGRLIRRVEFFKKYPDITPAEVFGLIDRLIDLLHYTRKNLAFPTYSNGIKHIQQYVATARENLKYERGANGLASLAWAAEAYQSREPEQFERIRSYNEMDIDMNRLVSDFIRRRAGDPVARQLKWTEKMEKLVPELTAAVETRRLMSAVLSRRELLETILGKPLSSLSAEQLNGLVQLLDRREYLARLRAYSQNPRLSKDEVDAAHQFEKFMLENRRQHQLYDFFSALNPVIVKNPKSRAAEMLVELQDSSSAFLTPRHLALILISEKMDRVMADLKISTKKSPSDRIVMPREIQMKLRQVRFDLDRLQGPLDLKPALLWGQSEAGAAGSAAEGAEADHDDDSSVAGAPTVRISQQDLEELWAGLYLERAFPVPPREAGK